MRVSNLGSKYFQVTFCRIPRELTQLAAPISTLLVLHLTVESGGAEFAPGPQHLCHCGRLWLKEKLFARGARGGPLPTGSRTVGRVFVPIARAAARADFEEYLGCLNFSFASSP